MIAALVRMFRSNHDAAAMWEAAEDQSCWQPAEVA